MGIDNIQDRIISEFEKWVNVKNKFTYFRKIAQEGNELPALPSSTVINENNVVEKINGRKIKIRLHARIDNGQVFFSVDSKNPISQGLIGLILRVLSGMTPKEIIHSNLYFINEISLYDHLNTDWIGDLLSVIQRIKSIAAGLQLKTI